MIGMLIAQLNHFPDSAVVSALLIHLLNYSQDAYLFIQRALKNASAIPQQRY